MTDPADAERDWLRRQLDEIAAEHMRAAAAAQDARRELDVRRRGFMLLAQLGGSLGAHTEIKPALAAALPVLERGLDVQRAVALELVDGAYVPFAWTGYRGADPAKIARARLELPERVMTEGLLVTRDAADEPWLGPAREALGVPVFAAAAVRGTPFVLVAGREAELSIFYLRLSRADVDTLAAVGDLVAAAVQNTQVAALAEIRRFVPPSVAEGLLRGGLAGAQGHERREVTLLAADMVGFTRLAETIDPDRLATILNGYLGEMTSLAHAHGGTVGSLAGDGVLVIFGAPDPVPPERHAWAAVQAAFAMRARLAALAGADDAPISIRIGLNTGPCAVGVFGSDTQRTYTAIGLPVNLAARLEAASAPGGILASESTLALVDARVHSVARGELTLKGFARPVPAFAVEPL